MLKKCFVLVLTISLYAQEKVGFVFDLEGTLAPTEWVWFLANDQLLEEQGIHIDDKGREKLNTMPAGCGLKRSIELLKERFEKLTGTVEELIQRKAALGFENIKKNEFNFYPGCEEFLTAIMQKPDCGMAIATNCSTDSLKVLSDKLKLPVYFKSHLYNPESVGGVAKPNPDVYLHAVQMIGLEPKQCIAFEDSLSGAQAAQKAGLYVVGYNSSDNPELEKYTDMIVKDWNDLDVDSLIEMRKKINYQSITSGKNSAINS